MGMDAPRRYSVTMSKVNRILFRRSGTLKMFFRLESTQGSSAVRELVALHRRTTGAVRRGQHGNGTPGGDDGGFGRLREAVGGDVERAGDLAPGQHLDEGALVGQAVGVEVGRRDLAEVVLDGDRVEGVEVDALVLHAEGVVEALQLGDALLEGHLAALE